MAPRILVVDDNPDDRALATRELRRALPDAQIMPVGDPAGLDRALAKPCFDLVVTDYELKWGDGIGVLRAVRSRCPDVPVIMFTASGSQEVAVEAMKSGLDDYVIKSPKHFVRLGAAAQACLRRAQSDRRATLLEVRQQGLLNRLAVGVCRFTLGGELIECNPAFLRLCGAASLDAARALDLSALHLDPDELARLLARPADEGEHVLRAAALARADGGRLAVSVNATLSTGPDVGGGKVVDCLVEDVTERERLTRELAAANAAKDEFLAVLSHELRTPLTPVLATVTAMEGDPGLAPEVRAAVTMIRRNVELEARIIDDLLDLTHIAKGTMQLRRELVDVHDAVRAALDICRSDLYAKKLRVTLDLAADRHFAVADAARLQQIFWNLLKNSIKFTPPGGHLTVRTGDAGGGRLRVEVSDTGAGIEPAALGRIFDAFRQADESVRRRFGGLGLGLSISKALAEAQGGTLRAASAGVDQGATFTLELPAAPAEQVAAREAAVRSERRRRPGEPLRILLVEDHADTLRVMSRLLTASGHQVTTASTVAAALKAAAAEAGGIDLVVSDLGLPDGSGIDLMQTLRERYGLRGIAVSGFGMESDVRASREAGFVDHVTKPINFPHLQASIERATSGKPA